MMDKIRSLSPVPAHTASFRTQDYFPGLLCVLKKTGTRLKVVEPLVRMQPQSVRRSCSSWISRLPYGPTSQLVPNKWTVRKCPKASPTFSIVRTLLLSSASGTFVRTHPASRPHCQMPPLARQHRSTWYPSCAASLCTVLGTSLRAGPGLEGFIPHSRCREGGKDFFYHFMRFLS